MPHTPSKVNVLLHNALGAQRNHVLGILEGLSKDDLHRPVLPSGWSCLGLVQHLAVDVERFWFWQVAAGNAVDEDAHLDDAWRIQPGTGSVDVFDLYRKELERSDKIIDETPLDEALRWWPQELFGTWKLNDLREVLVHVIAETATHAGHLDAARELIDGRTWLVLT